MHSIKIRKYESWSLNNTNNKNNFYEKVENSIILVSDKEINELEILGLEYLIKCNSKIWEGLDLDISINKAEYYKNSDTISPIYSYYYYNMNFIPVIKKATTLLLECHKELLNNAKDIIYIHYNATLRQDKSWLWKMLHKRKVNMCNFALED